MKRNLFAKFDFLLFLSSCMFVTTCSPLNDNDSPEGFVSINGQRFVDATGEEIVFHGLNLVNKNLAENYLGPEDQQTIKKIQEWGFNCIRLGVIWDGLEPESGFYDEKYLQGIDDRIRWAEENGLYVVIDMHQDLYSVLYSDGAPEWATLHEDKPHVTGEVWSESYFISPAVQTAFDNFWKNTPAPDGTGIRDHFINSWKLLANRYSNNPTVIGYDLMNEPFMGSGVTQIMPAMLQAYAELLASEGQDPPPSMEELSEMWTSGEGRNKVLEKLADPEKFSAIADAIQGIQAPFEKEVLMPFYQQCLNTIREVDSNHIIFIEHAIFANSGALTGIQPLLKENGERDPLVAYAPHGYDLVTDTKNQAASSLERVRFIFDRINQNADRLGMPVLVGEWGAFYGATDPAVVKQAEFILDQFQKHGFSHTYWSYFDGLEKMPYFRALQNR